LGIDTASVKFLCAAKSLDVNFTRTAMVGRQWFFPELEALRSVFLVLGIPENVGSFLRSNEYSESFFSLLGASEVVSLDFSSYEGATMIHDMNLPLPAELRSRFSVVHDGGTIEHIFNISQALKNCMEMVELGGHFIQVNMANNFMGHGFWQISPEMIFRAFSPANGFEIIAVLLHEVVPDGGWWIVTDPAKARQRVELCNSKPTYILTLAKRIAIVEVFETPPQQSDYDAVWDKENENSHKAPSRPLPSLLRGPVVTSSKMSVLFKKPFKKMCKRILELFGLYRFTDNSFERQYFRKIDEEDLLRGNILGNTENR
jgi:hypothetical protein